MCIQVACYVQPGSHGMAWNNRHPLMIDSSRSGGCLTRSPPTPSPAATAPHSPTGLAAARRALLKLLKLLKDRGVAGMDYQLCEDDARACTGRSARCDGPLAAATHAVAGLQGGASRGGQRWWPCTTACAATRCTITPPPATGVLIVHGWA